MGHIQYRKGGGLRQEGRPVLITTTTGLSVPPTHCLSVCPLWLWSGSGAVMVAAGLGPGQLDHLQNDSLAEYIFIVDR